MVAKIKEIADPDNSCKYIILNNKEILIDGRKRQHWVLQYHETFTKENSYLKCFDMNRFKKISATAFTREQT